MYSESEFLKLHGNWSSVSHKCKQFLIKLAHFFIQHFPCSYSFDLEIFVIFWFAKFFSFKANVVVVNLVVSSYLIGRFGIFLHFKVFQIRIRQRKFFKQWIFFQRLILFYAFFLFWQSDLTFYKSENLETILFETLQFDLWRISKNTIIKQLMLLVQKLKVFFAKIFVQSFYVT